MVHKTVLSNGTTVLLCPLHETEAVTVLVLVKVGSRYEAKEVSGVSHFIEHLMFKGTKRRPSSLALTKELDCVGAEFNAYTAQDHTAYHVKAVKEHLPLAMDILSDILHHSLFKSEEINRERGVIIEEIKMYEDNPLMSLGHIFDEALYGDHPLGRHIAGTIPVIQTVPREKILAYRDRHYHPDRLTVAVAGNFSEARALTLLKRHFGARGPRGDHHEFALAPHARRTGVFITYKDTKQVHLAMGTLGYHWGHPDYEAATLLSIILGGTMSSRLFIQVRERKGLCYYIHAGLGTFEDTGDFTVSAGVDMARVELALATIREELEKARRRGVTAEELTRAKKYLRGKVVLDLEDSESIADWYGKQYVFLRNLFTPQERLKKFMKVGLPDVLRVAKRLLDTKEYTLAMIGPYKDPKPFENALFAGK